VERLHRTAFDDGVLKLYHYEKFNPTYLTTTLRDNIVHCANPAKLNDPWDCKPAFDPHCLDDPATLEREIAMGPETPAKDLWEARLRTDAQAHVPAMLRASKSMEDMLAKRRIYCLTPKPDSILMWSHYAENHHGICLEFSVADNMLFRFAAKVEYRKEYPRWAPTDLSDGRRVMELILTKSSDWNYEEEYRLVNIAAPPSSSFLQLHGDFFRLPNGALKSVIMGCEADHQTIAVLIKEIAPDIPIKRAKRSPNLYKLEIVDYLPT
jgi:hypothetical protein